MGQSDGRGTMFREKYRTYITWGITVLLIILAGISFYFLVLRWEGIVSSVNTLSGILAPVSYGLIIAFILDSLAVTIVRLLGRIPHGGKPLSERRQRVFRAIGIVVSELIFVAVITVLIQSIVPQVIDSLRSLASNFDRYRDNLVAWYEPFVEENPSIQPYLESVREQADVIGDRIREFIKTDLLSLLNSVKDGLFEVGTYVYNFILGLIVSIYLLFSKQRLLGMAKKLLYTLVRPVSRANDALREARNVLRVFKGFFVGKLLDSIIIGVLCFIGTMVLRIPYALLISIVVGVTNIIPYFGPIIGAVPSAFLVLLLDPVKCFVFVIFIIVLQQIDGNVIGPKILGNTTGVSSLGVMLSILVGGGLFGVTGMILCVPTYAVIYSLIKRAAERQLDKSGLPTDSAAYVTLDDVDPDTLEPHALPVAAPRKDKAAAKPAVEKAGQKPNKKKK